MMEKRPSIVKPRRGDPSVAPRREHTRDGMNLKSQAVKGTTHKDMQWQKAGWRASTGSRGERRAIRAGQESAARIPITTGDVFDIRNQGDGQRNQPDTWTRVTRSQAESMDTNRQAASSAPIRNMPNVSNLSAGHSTSPYDRSPVSVPPKTICRWFWRRPYVLLHRSPLFFLFFFFSSIPKD